MPSILGCTSFKNDVREKFFELINRQEVPESKVLALDAERVITCVCKHYRISREQVLVSKRGTENLPRDIAIYLVHRFCCKTLPSVGEGNYMCLQALQDFQRTGFGFQKRY